VSATVLDNNQQCQYNPSDYAQMPTIKNVSLLIAGLSYWYSDCCG